MKRVKLLLTLLLFALIAHTQNAGIKESEFDKFFKPYGGIDTARRFVVYDNDSFCVVYHFGIAGFDISVARTVVDKDGKYDRLATDKWYADNCHYLADIYVYKIKDGIRVKSFKKIDGIYVPAGCFEDIPSNYVKKALSQ